MGKSSPADRLTPAVRAVRALALLGVLVLTGTVARAEEWTIAESESVFAVVTQKAGIAAGLAHDHLVVAEGAKVVLRFDPDRPLEARFELDVAASDLVVDDPDLRARWAPRLVELELLPDAGEDLSEKSRAKIARSMLGGSQLDAASHPRIAATIGGIRAKRTERAGAVFDYEVDLTLEVRGKAVTRPAAARYSLDAASNGGELLIEALATFQFTDFGIEPYSAMLGAVKNADEFYVYLNLWAKASR